MNDFQLDQVFEKNANEAFLRNVVFQDNTVTPFKSYLSRHLLDGHRIFSNSGDIEQQATDRHLYEEITKTKLIRPERGSTNVSTRDEGVVRERSALTRVFKDLIRGTRIAGKLDYHSAQRFASPLMVGNMCLYAHMECVPFRMLDEKGDVIDPRVKLSVKGSDKPYRVDSRFVLTIGWPERKEAPFLDNIIGDSPYPEDVIVNGRISWKDFMQCELFSDILQELSIEVTNEKPEKHPAIGMGAFFTELNAADFILPMSPVTFQKFPSFSDVGEPNWMSTFAPDGPSAISFSPSGFSPHIGCF